MTGQTETYEEKALTIIDQANALTVATLEDAQQAVAFIQSGMALKEEIDATFADLIKAAHEQHKAIIARAAKFTTPVDAAIELTKHKIKEWDNAQDEEPKIKGLSISSREAYKVPDDDNTIQTLMKLALTGKLPITLFAIDRKVYSELAAMGMIKQHAKYDPEISVTRIVSIRKG